jgi:hypothetical protein
LHPDLLADYLKDETHQNDTTNTDPMPDTNGPTTDNSTLESDPAPVNPNDNLRDARREQELEAMKMLNWENHHNGNRDFGRGNRDSHRGDRDFHREGNHN